LKFYGKFLVETGCKPLLVFP